MPSRQSERDRLLFRLRFLKDADDEEDAHLEADRLLLAYIGDQEITEAWQAIPKWFA